MIRKLCDRCLELINPIYGASNAEKVSFTIRKRCLTMGQPEYFDIDLCPQCTREFQKFLEGTKLVDTYD